MAAGIFRSEVVECFGDSQCEAGLLVGDFVEDGPAFLVSLIQKLLLLPGRIFGF